MGLALNLDKGSTTEEELKKAMKMVPAALHNTLYGSLRIGFFTRREFWRTTIIIFTEMTNRAKRIKLEPGTSSGYDASL